MKKATPSATPSTETRVWRRRRASMPRARSISRRMGRGSWAQSHRLAVAQSRRCIEHHRLAGGQAAADLGRAWALHAGFDAAGAGDFLLDNEQPPAVAERAGRHEDGGRILPQ